MKSPPGIFIKPFDRERPGLKRWQKGRWFDNAIDLYYLSQAYHRLGDHEASERAFDEAQRLYQGKIGLFEAMDILEKVRENAGNLQR